jgi:hypothetical protein
MPIAESTDAASPQRLTGGIMATAHVNDLKARCQALGYELFVAAGVFALGALVYALDRPAGSTPLSSALWALRVWPDYSFGRLGDHLPTFAHPFAFSVLTAVWLGPSWRAKACLVWLATNAVFELGQHAEAARAVADLLPHALERVALVDALASYLRNGTFDVLDLVSIGAGAAAAYMLLRYAPARVTTDG